MRKLVTQSFTEKIGETLRKLNKGTRQKIKSLLTFSSSNSVLLHSPQCNSVKPITSTYSATSSYTTQTPQQ